MCFWLVGTFGSDQVSFLRRGFCAREKLNGSVTITWWANCCWVEIEPLTGAVWFDSKVWTPQYIEKNVTPQYIGKNVNLPYIEKNVRNLKTIHFALMKYLINAKKLLCLRRMLLPKLVSVLTL